MEVLRFFKVDSTNSTARKLICRGDITSDAVVVAEVQRAGRGRRDRRWHSPSGGLWMTRVIPASGGEGRIPVYPLLAGVAAVRAVAKTTGVTTALKWPNDIMWKGCKMGGILCRKVSDFILMGVGLNLKMPWKDLPDIRNPRPVDLFRAAGGFSGGWRGVREELVTALSGEIDELTADGIGTSAIFEAWRAYSCTLNRPVVVCDGHERVEGEAVDIDRQGRLLVRTACGEVRRFSAGDVSVRRAESGGARDE